MKWAVLQYCVIRPVYVNPIAFDCGPLKPLQDHLGGGYP